MTAERNAGYTGSMVRRPSVLSDPFAADQEEAIFAKALSELRAKISSDGQNAVTALASFLAQGGALVFPLLRAWAEDHDPQVRKSLVKAAEKAADPADPFRAVFLFGLIEPLLWDPDPSVRTLARKALREKLLPTYPEEALEILAQWTADPDPKKKIFAVECLGRLPPSLARRALILLRHLGRSEEGKVRKAVIRALRRWRWAAPNPVEGELRGWLADPGLSELAQRALS
ncbi:MAG: HEAT repeat domain-containing protein [Candidatus Bipolaricaulaceae bacterium]